jgi:uncharacterized membrane-anchored protein
MNHRYSLFVASIIALVTVTNGHTRSLDAVKWQEGPSIGNLGGVAEVHVPAGYVFAGADDTRLIMEAMENPTNGTEVGFVAPAGEDWFVVFEFSAVGYVRDDEKNSLNADAMLEAIKRGNDASNKERQRRGWPIMTILGWEQKPHYNEVTHNLEWSIRAEGEEEVVVNHNTRLLGRGGVMRVTLVADPMKLSSILPQCKDVLSGYRFTAGHGYSEFRPGDKVAKYGLTALVVGGATAVAVKTGIFKWVWKGLVVGFIALAAFVKSLFSKKRSQRVNP